MGKISLNGASINTATASGHIQTERYIQTGTGGGECNAWDEDGACIGYAPTYPIYEWVGGYTADAQIDGTVQATTNQVFIQGKNAILNGDSSTENDSYNLIPDERYVSGQHTGATGSVTTGNSRNVFIGGKQVSIDPTTVRTHSGVNTTIRDGFSSTVFIGG